MKARTLKPLPEPVVTLPSKVRELNAQLGEGDESQPVELPGPAWAELVRLADEACYPGGFLAAYRDQVAAVRRSLEQLEEFKTDLEHLLSVPTPSDPARLIDLVVELLHRAGRTAPALPGGPALPTGERFEAVPPPKKKRERKRKTPEQVIAAQAEAEAKTCEECGDDGHSAADCYFRRHPDSPARPAPRPPGRVTRKFPLGTGLTEKCTKCGAELGAHAGTKCPPKPPAQVELEDVIGGAP